MAKLLQRLNGRNKANFENKATAILDRTLQDTDFDFFEGDNYKVLFVDLNREGNFLTSFSDHYLKYLFLKLIRKGNRSGGDQNVRKRISTKKKRGC